VPLVVTSKQRSRILRFRNGGVSVLLGLIVLIAPGARALGLVWVIAAYSIAFGISFVALAFWLKNRGHAAA
jgi:uncharacterized membrane protein HdeD (DUF308 family)